jgi:demethylmenaquinone methyltransferase/2-methoxy-6-polyprenyl-1,4-benzoquinol methylase
VTIEPAAAPLNKFFATVARRYDVANRVMTLGLDQTWRRRAARECLRGRPRRVLDLCCGTGDLTVMLARAAGEGARVVGADFSRGMLAVARRKLRREGLSRSVEFVRADAAELPFEDDSFDAVGIAFAFRNLTFRNPNRERHLAEMLRVLSPGGRLVVVETSQPARALVRWGSHLYLGLAAGAVGALLSGERGAYRYLAYSAANFSTAGEVAELLRGSGFGEVKHRSLLWGVAAIHVATKRGG